MYFFCLRTENFCLSSVLEIFYLLFLFKLLFYPHLLYFHLLEFLLNKDWNIKTLEKSLILYFLWMVAFRRIHHDSTILYLLNFLNLAFIFSIYSFIFVIFSSWCILDDFLSFISSSLIFSAAVSNILLIFCFIDCIFFWFFFRSVFSLAVLSSSLL